jgi:hypothetical protein
MARGKEVRTPNTAQPLLLGDAFASGCANVMPYAKKRKSKNSYL